MRNKRVDKFKKKRFRKVRNILLLTVVIPCILALLGYLVASIIILPSIPG